MRVWEPHPGRRRSAISHSQVSFSQMSNIKLVRSESFPVPHPSCICWEGCGRWCIEFWWAVALRLNDIWIPCVHPKKRQFFRRDSRPRISPVIEFESLKMHIEIWRDGIISRTVTAATSYAVEALVDHEACLWYAQKSSQVSVFLEAQDWTLLSKSFFYLWQKSSPGRICS